MCVARLTNFRPPSILSFLPAALSSRACHYVAWAHLELTDLLSAVRELGEGNAPSRPTLIRLSLFF